MTRPRAGLLSRPTRADRKMARRAVGPLSSAIITAKTKHRYDYAVAWFFAWLSATGFEVPATLLEFDDLVALAVDTAWQEGESRSLVGDLLSGLCHHLNPLRTRLPSGWRLWSAWGRLELPSRAWPLLPVQLEAMCYVASQWEMLDVAIVLWIGFQGLLRTAEYTTLAVGQLHFQPDLNAFFVSLPFTKGSARKGAPEGVAIQHHGFTQLLAQFCNGLSPGDPLLRRTAAQFRAAFNALVAAIRLEGEYRPYSIRRGGATAWFRQCASLDETTDRGRWSNSRTARIYVNTALADLINQRQASDVLLYTGALSDAWRTALQ